MSGFLKEENILKFKRNKIFPEIINRRIDSLDQKCKICSRKSWFKITNTDTYVDNIIELEGSRKKPMVFRQKN